MSNFAKVFMEAIDGFMNWEFTDKPKVEAYVSTFTDVIVKHRPSSVEANERQSSMKTQQAIATSVIIHIIPMIQYALDHSDAQPYMFGEKIETIDSFLDEFTWWNIIKKLD